MRMSEGPDTPPLPPLPLPLPVPTPPTQSPPVEDDTVLVERSQRGDTVAFDALVIKYTPRLYGLVYHMTGNHEDTHDILQEVFAKAYRSVRRFRGSSTFYTWIYSIAVNMTLNFLKKRKRARRYGLDEAMSLRPDTPPPEAVARDDTRREVGIRELQERLNIALRKLSNEHRAVVTMFDIQGLPHAEIAKILGISEGTVRSRLHYAHQQLQNHLADFHHP